VDTDKKHKIKTVKIEEAFFETTAGVAALESYSSWLVWGKDHQHRGKTILKKLGLSKEAPAKIKGGLAKRIMRALDGETLTLEEVTASINKTLTEEENGESVTLKQVRCCINFQLKTATKKHAQPRVIEEDGSYKLADMEHPKLKTEGKGKGAPVAA